MKGVGGRELGLYVLRRKKGLSLGSGESEGGGNSALSLLLFSSKTWDVKSFFLEPRWLQPDRQGEERSDNDSPPGVF